MANPPRSNNLSPIYVDDREDKSRPGVQTFSSRLRELGAEVEVGRVEFGDFWFHGKGGKDGPPVIAVGIERKALFDLLGCMTSGRLAASQAPGMHRDYDITFLVIEGVWRTCPQTGLLQKLGRDRAAVQGNWRARMKGKPPAPAAQSPNRWMDVQLGGRTFKGDAVRNYIYSLQMLSGMKVVATGSRGETADWVAGLWRWWQKGLDHHKSFSGLEKPQSKGMGSGAEGDQFLAVGGKRPGLVARVASQLPGIGPGRAIAAEGVFKSVEDMVSADAERWREVAGVGKMVSETVWKSIREEGAK